MTIQQKHSTGDHPTGRLTTLPLRYLAYTLFVAVCVTELLFWNMGFCGFNLPLSWPLTTIFLLGAFVGLDWWEQRTFLHKPPFWIAVGIIAFKMVLIETSAFFTCSGFHQFFGLLPPLIAYLYISRRAALLTAGINILIAVQWIFMTFDGYDFSIEQFRRDQLENDAGVFLFLFIVGNVLSLIIGWVLSQEEKNREQAKHLVTELEASQKKVEELAKVSERNRIAREIHDTIGHHLTAINIQIEKAQAFRPINPAEADQALVDAKRSAQSALADVRDSVSALRDQNRQFDLESGLERLVDGFRQVPTELHFEGSETIYSKASLIALYRVAQEGLTNIGKHAKATAAELNVYLTDDYGILTLKDNGIGLDGINLEKFEASTDAHFGLLGLQERLELIGGTLEITSEKEQGTTLHVLVPSRGLG